MPIRRLAIPGEEIRRQKDTDKMPVLLLNVAEIVNPLADFAPFVFGD